jgi:dolichol-phosphate mannosyltransferase
MNAVVEPLDNDHQESVTLPAVKPPEIDISFFIPCYNEESNVVGAIEKVVSATRRIGCSFEILVFDDASEDETANVVRSYQKQHPEIPVKLFTNAVNCGVSRNFVTGAFNASGEFYRLVCGDDIEPLETHIEILSHRAEADIIVPFYTKIKGRPFRRHVISRLYTLIVNLANGRSLKYYNGCPLYRRDHILRWHVETTGFGYQAELLCRLLQEDRSYVEVPLVSSDREGSGSINIRNIMSVAHSLLNITLRRLRVRLFK